jgi:hypothetical protein
MEKYDELWNDLNTLMSYLKGNPAFRTANDSYGYEVVQLINNRYKTMYNNTAPGILLKDALDKIQKHLDSAI